MASTIAGFEAEMAYWTKAAARWPDVEPKEAGVFAALVRYREHLLLHQEILTLLQEGLENEQAGLGIAPVLRHYQKRRGSDGREDQL